MPRSEQSSTIGKIAIWLGAGVLVIAAFVGTVVYTERPAFCTSCHEMQPYYDAWAVGQHNSTSCIDCHVESGLQARFLHKFVALKEVWYHFTTEPTFPSLSVDVPDSRCTPCHEKVDVEIADGLSHAEHISKLACQQCHASTGHRITFASLDAAGILRPGAQMKGAEVVGESLAAQGSPSALSGHIAVTCSDCHDMVRASCLMCHKPPARHFVADCSVCHKSSVSFEDTEFRHPKLDEHNFKEFPCGSCHPDGFASASCVQCHKDGVPEDD